MHLLDIDALSLTLVQARGQQAEAVINGSEASGHENLCSYSCQMVVSQAT